MFRLSSQTEPMTMARMMKEVHADAAMAHYAAVTFRRSSSKMATMSSTHSKPIWGLFSPSLRIFWTQSRYNGSRHTSSLLTPRLRNRPKLHSLKKSLVPLLIYIYAALPKLIYPKKIHPQPG